MIKRIIFSLTLILAAAAAHGEQKDGFWDKLQYKLEKVTPTKKAASTTAVGGVRGAKNDESADIYWKGKDKTLEMSEEELLKFNQAVETKMKGDNELALKQFEEFLALYPQSSYRVEGLQAVDKIKLEIYLAKNPPKIEAVVPPQKEIAATSNGIAAQPIGAAFPVKEIVPMKEVAPPAVQPPAPSLDSVSEPVK